MKFNLPERPDDEIPDLPIQPDALSDTDLMETYSRFVAWADYAHAELVKAELDEEEAQFKLSSIEAIVMSELPTAKGERVTAMKAKRDADDRVQQAMLDHHQARVYRKLVQTVYDRCERDSNFMSRELSRRIAKNPRDRSQRFSP
jgi:hypothetical protein